MNSNKLINSRTDQLVSAIPSASSSLNQLFFNHHHENRTSFGFHLTEFGDTFVAYTENGCCWSLSLSFFFYYKNIEKIGFS